MNIMNRKKKMNQTLKARLKRSNAKLHRSSKPKYISKAERAKLELAEQEENTNNEIASEAINDSDVGDEA